MKLKELSRSIKSHVDRNLGGIVNSLVVMQGSQGAKLFRVGENICDFKQGTVTRGGQDIPLEAKELGALRTLVEHASKPVTYEVFRDSVWDGAEAGLEANVRTRISNLRSKLGLQIKNQRGTGYLLLTPVKTMVHGEPLSPARGQTGGLVPANIPIAESPSDL